MSIIGVGKKYKFWRGKGMWRAYISRFLAPCASGIFSAASAGIESKVFLIRKIPKKMIGDPDIVKNDRLAFPTCHEERSQGSDCAENLSERRALPIAHLHRSSQVDFATRSKLLVVEGNIGVGKTTLAKKLAGALGYKLCLEPTTENPYLEKFYADPHKYALKLQLWILHQRYTTYVEAVNHVLRTDQGVILDRSVYSDCVFAQVCTNEGFISSEGYKEYIYWRERCLEHLPMPHVTIFLDANPQCCYDRIQSRARDCESGVTLDYLEKLHEQYHQFIEQMRSEGTYVLRYDWSTFREEKIVCDAITDIGIAKWKSKHIPTEDRIIPKFSLLEAV